VQQKDLPLPLSLAKDLALLLVVAGRGYLVFLFSLA
jgi:hypothetical protein